MRKAVDLLTDLDRPYEAYEQRVDLDSTRPQDIRVLIFQA